MRASGAKSWFIRIQTNGRRRDIGLGSYPEVSLAEARERAMQIRKQCRAGLDPVDVKRKARLAAAEVPTFRDAAEQVHTERSCEWDNAKHRNQWISTLRIHAFPALGNKPIDAIVSADIHALLLPIWQKKPETARRVLQRVAKILDWGFAKGYCSSEAPIRSIRAGLSRQNDRPKHFASLDHQLVPSLMVKLSESDTSGRLALRFLILTAARSGEVRGASWNEIRDDLWTIPASRMKSRREHVVPLSKQACKVLKVAEGLRKGGANDLIFPGLKERAMSDMTMAKVFQTAMPGEWTVHGFRSSFRMWAAERLFPHDVAESALAHTIRNKVVVAYLRTDFLDQRRPMMEEWGAYLTNLAST